MALNQAAALSARQPVKFARLMLAIAVLAVTGSTFAQKPQVVATIHPYYDLTRQVGGDLIEVTRLLPIGASPHSFDPTPRDVVRVASADLVIRNGGVGLDEWVLPLITASVTDAQVLSVMDEIEFTPLGTSAADGDLPATEFTDFASAEGYFVNSHIWLDVTIAMSASEAIAEALMELDPANAAQYRSNLDELLKDLDELDRELLEMLEPVRGAVFVPFHDAWPYFANHYGLNLLIEIEPFPGREPSPEYLIYAIERIQDSGAKAIFSERQLSPRPAEVVAAEVGLPLYVLDPEGGGADSAESYQELLRFNAGVLLEALAE